MSDYYNEQAAMTQIDRDFTAAAQSHSLSFDSLAKGCGYQPICLRRVIGDVISPRQVRIAIALLVSEPENVELLGEAYVRSINPGMPPGLSAQSQAEWIKLPALERMAWELMMGAGL